MHHIAHSRYFLAEIIGLIKLVRLRQWIKNLFVFAPLIFTGQFIYYNSIYIVIVTALLFCLAASAVYIVNDIKDIERDRAHPEKNKKRPLASGQVSLRSALLLLFLIYAVLVYFLFLIPNVIYIIFTYIVLNLFYTFKLKHEPVVEIFIIAFGFVLRVYAGAVALDVPVSNWMFISTLSISLFLASIKRRQELIQNGTQSRGVLAHYSVELINRFASMSAVMAVVFYSLYVMTVQPKLILSLPFVIFGLFRYWFIVEILSGGESPTDVMLGDWQIILTVLGWVLCCVWGIWP